MSVSLKSCLLVFILSVSLPSLCFSAPSESESMTNFLDYINSLKGCVVKHDLKSCSNAVKGKLLKKEQRAVEQIQKDIEAKCFKNIAGGSVGLFNCYLAWLTNMHDSLVQRIETIGAARKKMIGDTSYQLCIVSHQSDRERAKRCLQGCEENNFMSCKKALEICLRTKKRDAMEVCVKKGIDIKKNPHF